MEKEEINARLERLLGLHQTVEIKYVVDGFEARLSRDDGDTWVDFKADTPIDALEAMLDYAGN